MRNRLATLLLFAAATLSVSAYADPLVIASFDNGSVAHQGGSGSATTYYAGEEFTTASGLGNFTQVSVALYQEAYNGQTMSGPSSLYLFSSAYAGQPGSISTSSSGYLATGTYNAVTGAYDFGNEVFDGGTNYFVFGAGAFSVSPNKVFVFNDTPGLPVAFASVSSTAAYISQSGKTLDFKVTGDVVAATPEPSSIALLGTGLLSVGGMVRRRLRNV